MLVTILGRHQVHVRPGHGVQGIFGTVDMGDDHGVIRRGEPAKHVGQSSLDGVEVFPELGRNVNLDRCLDVHCLGRLGGLATAGTLSSRIASPLPGFGGVL